MTAVVYLFILFFLCGAMNMAHDRQIHIRSMVQSVKAYQRPSQDMEEAWTVFKKTLVLLYLVKWEHGPKEDFVYLITLAKYIFNKSKRFGTNASAFFDKIAVGGGEGGTGDTFPGPHEAFIFMIFTFLGCIFTLFLYLSLSRHCLDSMSEHLGRIMLLWLA